MADNVTTQSATPASVPAGGSYAFDDIGGVLYQRQKISAGADGAGADVIADGAAGLAVGGSLAHDAVESGNPIAIGGIARTANPAAVAALDRVRAWFTVLGKLVTEPFAPRDLAVDGYAQLTNTTETDLLAAGGSGLFQDLTTIVIGNQTATAVVVAFRDAAAGSVRFRIPIAANGGAVISLPKPIKQTTANNKWTAQLSAGSITVDILVVGYKTL